MDIQSFSTAMAQHNVQQQASVFLLRSSLNLMKTQGTEVIDLVSTGTDQNTNYSQNPAGVGTVVDVYA
ncbi:MAG: YjfB family protein [Treponema sp.]|jgi:hypothetical protein|nr:YjfB family protein [Treponema sp.]